MGRQSGGIPALLDVLSPKMVTNVIARCRREEKRCRKLPAELVAWLVIGASLFRDLSLSNVLECVSDAIGLKSWGPSERPHPTSIAHARDRLGSDAMRTLFEEHAISLKPRCYERITWRSRPLVTLDGTTSTTPDSPENDEHFGRPGSAKGTSAFPQLRYVLVVSVLTHLVINAAVGPYTTSEARLADEVLSKIAPRSILLLDRAYFSFLWPARMHKHGLDYVIRIKQGNNVYTPVRVRRLGKDDWLCELPRPKHLRDDPGNLPSSVPVRLIKCRRRGLRPIWIITSLLSAEEYPRDEIAALYRDRWEAELAYREIKAELVRAQVKFRSIKPERVLQEFYGLLIAYNCTRALMCEAAQRAEVPPTQLSFIDSLFLIRRTVNRLPDGEDLITSLSFRRLPPRRTGRKCPRAVKNTTPSKFPRKRRGPRGSTTPRVRRARERAMRRALRA